MESYERFAQFYDAVMGDRKESNTRILEFVREFHPQATNVLELACGTGTVLQYFKKRYKVSGLDLSSKMLAVAKGKIPGAKFYHQDMTTFSIDEKFDVIFCVFDSINHVLRFADWEKMFSTVSRHLTENGLFIFDINTEKKLKRHVSERAWIHRFGENFLVMDVTDAGRGITNWNVKVFEHAKGNQYLLQEEDIREISFPVARITSALKKKFSRVVLVDTDKNHPIKKGDRFYFICKK